MNQKLNWFAWVSVIIIGIISCIKFIHEPDVWWQIRTGQWILENGQVPKTDIFSYTFLNEPWINVKWFAEVLMAGVNNLFGPEWLILLQIGCIILILLFSFKMSQVVFKRKNAKELTVPRIGIMLAGLLLLIAINYRMNSRPEMFSHLLVIVFLYYLYTYSLSKSNWLYIIIPLQILWTNTHEAFGMGIVLILIFLFAHWTEYLFFRKEKPIRFTIIGFLAIFSTAINPNGAKMIAHPFNIFGQLSENKFTTELLGYKDAAFWQYQAYVMLIVFILCVFYFLKLKKGKLYGLEGVVNLVGLPYLLILIAFFYLSLTAFRNIPFFMIVTTPLIANFVDSKVKTEKSGRYYTILLMSFFIYGIIASNTFYEKFLPREKFGIGVNAETTPIGAANFLKANQIKGKGFVDYLSSAYFLYELQPDYKSFIDLRDLDVFHTTFFEHTFRVYQAPESPLTSGQTLWEYYKELDEFNYIVLLNSPPFKPLNNLLVHTDDSFELVYADNLNSVYLRQNNDHQNLINDFGLLNGKNDVYHQISEYNNSTMAETISKILWPFNRPEDAEKTSLLRNLYYQYIGVSPPKLGLSNG